jgi:sugar fermentation stimulation protein A
MSLWVYHYPQLWSGILVKRYKRFFADIELETGEVITAHCPNTGPMTGICVEGNPVRVSKSDNPNRKLAYTWELIQVDDPPTWVGVNTSLPNRAVRKLLEAGAIAPLAQYQELRSEVPYGQEKSRIDFLLTDAKGKSTYIEVKNTTWTDGPLALFPDTVTTRGQKHLRELMGVVPEARAGLIYFVNRGDCTAFAPGDTRDPEYGVLLRQAVDCGVEVYPCGFEVSPEGITFTGVLPLKL